MCRAKVGGGTLITIGFFFSYKATKTCANHYIYIIYNYINVNKKSVTAEISTFFKNSHILIDFIVLVSILI